MRRFKVFLYTCYMSELPIQLWDPLDDQITVDTYKTEQNALLKKKQTYENNPYLLRMYLGLWVLVALVCFCLIFITGVVQFVVGVVPIFLFYQSVMRSEEELILYLLCEKNNWAYNPSANYNRAQDLATLTPEIFNFGYDQNVEEQVWGIVKNNMGIDSHFWTANFCYTTGSGKNTKTYTQYICMFRLHKAVEVAFSLTPAGIFNKFEDHIKTESEEFNSIFQIQADSSDSTQKELIIQILSPSVITRLIDFSGKYSTKIIKFQYGVMIIVLEHKIWKTSYTNFFKQIAIDPRDETVFYNSLMDMAELPTEMVQFIS